MRYPLYSTGGIAASSDPPAPERAIMRAHAALSVSNLGARPVLGSAEITMPAALRVGPRSAKFWCGLPRAASWSNSAMIEGISAITLATHDMGRAVRFYSVLGFEIIFGGEEAAFTSFRPGRGYLTLIAHPADRTGPCPRRAIFSTPAFAHLPPPPLPPPLRPPP